MTFYFANVFPFLKTTSNESENFFTNYIFFFLTVGFPSAFSNAILGGGNPAVVSVVLCFKPMLNCNCACEIIGMSNGMHLGFVLKTQPTA